MRRSPYDAQSASGWSSDGPASSAQLRSTSRLHSGVSGGLVAVLFVVSIGIASVPIFGNQFLSINDYYNHLARTAVLLHGDGDPTFSRYFLPNWQLLPNLAFDLWVWGLGQILPVALAGKLFIVATFALTLSGVIFFHRLAFGRWSLWPFLALLLLYNRLLLAGYLNFLFGVGLWLHALSLWVRFHDARAWLRSVMMTAAALVIFFMHLAAFGVLAVTIVVYELATVASNPHRWSAKFASLLFTAASFAPAVLLAFFLSPHSEASGAVRYRDLATRVAGFAAPILYDWRIDAVCCLILLGLFAWAATRKSIDFDPKLAACAAALFALQFLMPNVIVTAEGGDRRLPLPMMLLAIAATDLRTGRHSQRFGFILAAGVVFILRIANVEARWQSDQPIYDDITQGLSLLPAGAQVASALPPDSFDDFSVPAVAISYLPVWEIVPRGGFTQTLFAYPTQQPLTLTTKYEALAAATPPGLLWQAFVADADPEKPDALSPKLVAALHEYEFIAFFGQQNFTVRDTALFQSFYAGQYVRIYRLGRQ